MKVFYGLKNPLAVDNNRGRPSSRLGYTIKSHKET